MVSDLDLFGVCPQVWVGALERPLAEQLNLLIQRPAQCRDPVLRHRIDPELLHEPAALARPNAVHVRLQHDRDDRLLRAPARLKEAREIRRPGSLLRNQQLDLAGPRLPRPRPIPIAMRQPRLRRDLAQPGADLSRDLALHQLPGDQRDRLPHEILKPTIHRPGDDIGNRHALTLGHRGFSFIDCGTADEFGAAVADPSQSRTDTASVTPLLPTRPADRRYKWPSGRAGPRHLRVGSAPITFMVEFADQPFASPWRPAL